MHIKSLHEHGTRKVEELLAFNNSFSSWIRFPIWPYAKLIAICWLVLPYFNGAAYVYAHFIRPFYRNPQVKIWYIPRKKDIFRKPDDILSAAERYIEENGPEEFERLISRVCPILIIHMNYARFVMQHVLVGDEFSNSVSDKS